MINIMYVVYDFGIGGLEKCVDLVNSLDQAEFRSSICCLRRSGDSARKLRRADVKIFEMCKRNGHDLTLPFRLAKLLKENNIDIIHSANWGTYLESIAGARLAGMSAHVHMEQGMEFGEYNETDTIKRKLRIHSQRLFSPSVNKIVAVSEEIRGRFIDRIGIIPEKIVTIPNGVDTEFFKPEKKTRKCKRSELGLGETTIIMGSVGRLSRVKNYTILLEAFERVLQDRSDIHLLMVGDGPERRELEHKASSLDLLSHVTFLGQRNDTKDILNVMDIFILPSIFEGLSVSVLEAMSVGLPVIASNVGGNPEIIQHRKTGFLFESSNVNDLVSLITENSNGFNLRERVGMAARNRVVDSFSLRVQTKSYSRIYQDCLR